MAVAALPSHFLYRYLCVQVSVCVCNEDLCVLFFTQGGGGKDDDYVTRIEFRLLLVSLTTVLSAM